MRASILVVLGLATTASAEPAYRTEVHLVEPAQLQPFATVNTHTFYINRCLGGCTVTNGTSDSRSDHSDIAAGVAQLAEFNQSQAVWDGMMACLRETYSRFNIIITDIDPGTAPHIEVMVAGLAGQLNSQLDSNSTGGIADVACSAVGSCDNFIPNALSFTFANAAFYKNKPLELCSTSAQEIAHTWSLDHVVDATDPMTYNNYSGMREYKDGQVCGSDCLFPGNKTSLGVQCQGSGGQATHVCFNGNATQNEVQVITGLFGSSGPKPTVKITSPAADSAVQNMFEVDVDCTASDGVAMVQVSIDGKSAGMKTAAPFTFNAPSGANGPHHVVAFCAATGGGQATAEIDVTQGTPCNTAAECQATEICYRGACVAGPSSSGGLGATCMNNTDCVGGSCSSDGTEQHCTLPCDPNADQCPSGFGCLQAGSSGVCWPGADSGSGFCNGSGGGSAVMFCFAFAAFVVIRRRRS